MTPVLPDVDLSDVCTERRQHEYARYVYGAALLLERRADVAGIGVAGVLVGGATG